MSNRKRIYAYVLSGLIFGAPFAMGRGEAYLEGSWSSVVVFASLGGLWGFIILGVGSIPISKIMWPVMAVVGAIPGIGLQAFDSKELDLTYCIPSLFLAFCILYAAEYALEKEAISEE